MNKFRLLCAAAAIVAPASAYAQETTSSITGSVSAAGAPVEGAAVTVTHVPTSSAIETSTGNGGIFHVSGLRPGGPYTVQINAPGREPYQITDIVLTVGEPFTLPIELGTATDTIVVTATSIGGRGRGFSPTTTLRADDIAGVATVNRDVRDLINRSPFATIDATNVRATSVAGANPRFNRFSVNGVQFNDDFGLNNGGLPTSRGPVPLEAICQFTVEVAPASIREGFFQGGAINTQLCTGSNDFTGGAFYTYNDDTLTGDEVRGAPVVLDIENQAYGAWLRGPIVPDRLFFALAWERTRETEPQLFGPAGEPFSNPIGGITRAEVDQVRNIVQTLFRFDPGDVPTAIPEDDDRITARIDFRVNEDNDLSFTYIFNDGSQFVDGSSSTAIGNSLPRLALFSNSYTLTERVHSGVIQLNSRWSDEFSTEARVSYRDYDRGQTPPNGRDFGEFNVCLDATSAGSLTLCTPGSGVIRLGPDISRQANILQTNNLDGQLTANLLLGRHNLQFLAQYTNIDIYNLFLQRASGAFYFDSLADLTAGRANQLDLAQSTSGDIDDAAAIFDFQAYVFGLQDTWNVSEDLTIIAGVRSEFYGQGPAPLRNEFFTARYGFSNQVTLADQQILLPRLGFSWRATDRLNVRGALGRYAAGTPNVWVSNSYSNTGVSQNRVTFNRATAAGNTCTGTIPADICAAAINNVFGGGLGIPQNVRAFVQTNVGALSLAGVNAIDPDFEIPAQWRAALTLAYNADLGPLGDNWFFAADALYGWVDQAIDYIDLRSVPVGVAPDGRTRYGPFASTAGSSNSDLLLTNSTEGHNLVLVGRFEKRWDIGLNIGAAYTWMDITERSPLTSSVAFSNYQNQATAEPNGSSLGNGNEQIRHAVRFNIGFRREFIRNSETRIDIFGNWRQGRPYSYTFDANQSFASPFFGRDQVFGVFGSDNRHLMYVPTGPTDPLVSYDSNTTRDSLDAFINSTALSGFRGNIAGKNIGRSPDFTKIDLRIQQTIPLFGFGRLRLFADMENVLNFIDNDWGSLRQVSFPFLSTVVDVACVPAGPPPANQCASYRYSNFRTPFLTTFTTPSLWALRLGARFEF
ncbi:MAG: TonB-dependent receptor domain-containing protein [Sphingosinicella sp.]